MAEENAAAQAEQVESAAEERTFTQEQVNEIVKERLARAKAKAPDDYEELKAKAAKFDEAEEAAKSELQKATEKAEKYKAELDKLKADAEREAQLNEAVEKYGIDRKLLSRMAGDIDENAQFLAEMDKDKGKYPNVADGGEANQRHVPKKIPTVF